MAVELAGELGGLPLALEQAAAYVQASADSLAGYLASFRQRRADLLARGEPAGYIGTVATAWAVAFADVAQSAPGAAGLLRLLAFCAPEAIPLRAPDNSSVVSAASAMIRVICAGRTLGARAVLLIIRRPWVRSPPAPPDLTCGYVLNGPGWQPAAGVGCAQNVHIRAGAVYASPYRFRTRCGAGELRFGAVGVLGQDRGSRRSVCGPTPIL